MAFCLYNSFYPLQPFLKYHSPETESVREEKAKSDSPDEYARYFSEITTMEGKDHSGYIPGYRLMELNKSRQNMAGLRTKEITWTERGPGNVAGRTRGLIIHPDDPSGRTWLAGSAGGGVFGKPQAVVHPGRI